MNIIKSFIFLYASVLITIYSCNSAVGTGQSKEASIDYIAKNSAITVDGKFEDWQKIPAKTVNRKENIWLGDGLPEGNWQGEKDLSFSWKAAHHDGKLFFLIEVKDDTLSTFRQENSWMNDCVEIHLDHQGLKGDRIIGIGEKNTLEDRFGKVLRGHEMQFLPTAPGKVFFDDSKAVYYTNKPQTDLFNSDWHGEFISKRTPDGYILEIGFAIPNFYVKAGQEMGIDLAVCDDDGRGRKSLLVYSAFKGPFWLTMDNFKKLKLE